jgi:hypothetical protein
MRRARYLIGAAALAVGAVAIGDASPARAERRALHAFMTGAKEAPGPGDPDGFGAAGFLINTDTGRICYVLTVARIDPANAAHIHQAPPGQPGPVVVALQPTNANGFRAACTTAAPALAKAIAANPGVYYVNVHNAAFQNGAVRGQLR